MPDDRTDAGAPEIDVTEAMIAAGKARLRSIPVDQWLEYKLDQIYRAMEAARRDPAILASYARLPQRDSRDTI
jgi:hypothetical protein